MKKQNPRYGSGISISTLKSRASKKSKNILVPMDGSPNSFRALKYARDNAKNSNQKIIGLYVIPTVAYIPFSPIAKIKKIHKEQGIKFLKKAKKQCSSHHVDFNFKIISGDVGQQIVKFAKKVHADEIIMGFSNQGKLQRLFLGSTSNYVINETKLPVTLIK